MTRFLKCEYMKSRRRLVFVTALALTAMALAVALYGDYEGESGSFILENGYMMFLYQLPLINTIFFPLLCMVTASRLADLEHRGENLKMLCTLMDKGRLFDAKLLYGLSMVMCCLCLYWGLCLLAGSLLGFGGPVPVKLHLVYLLFTIIPTAAVYVFQHSLSMLFKNQALPLCIGSFGVFAGLFSMFLPQLPWLRRSLLWGYYGALQFVGLYGWDKDTRYRNAWFELMGYDWLSFAIICLLGLAIYAAGRTLFCRKEM